MSLQAMHTAATGMEAFLFNLDTIANNLANAGTTGFKRSRVNFEDLYYQQIKAPGGLDAQGKPAPIGIAVGLGARVAGTAVDHRIGSIISTEQQLDLAIQGDGFFQIQDGSQVLYTRAGNFARNADGQLVMSSANRGRLVEPSISLPPDSTSITIGADGSVLVTTSGSTTATNLGQIQTVRFTNPQGLVSLGENLYGETDASGPPLVGIPGLEGRGSLLQGYLEASNTEPVRELVGLIKTQRNFELSSQVIQAADQTLQLVANLRRF